MRMEDLDPPREQAGAADSLLDSLRAHGLEWDGPVLWQSKRHDAYAEAVHKLLDEGMAFRCDCSRAQLSAQGNIYRGHCRSRELGPDQSAAIRIRVEGEAAISVHDRVQANLFQDLASELGDFIIQRRDGLYAYQLAVVLDDEYQGINQVLRGTDLYDSTPRQIYLQEVLGFSTPTYTHIPVITNSAGNKLSKQTHAPAVDDSKVIDNLRLALRFLGQKSPPGNYRRADRLLQAAVEQWQLDAIPARQGIPETTLY